jgi:hypothetical protein
MTKKIPIHLKNTTGIIDLFKKHDVVFDKNEFDGKSTVKLLHIDASVFKNNHKDFFDLVKDEILHSFVFPYSEVQKKLVSNTQKEKDELLAKAVRKISSHTAKGELGELILFALIETFIGAPKILSKISMKTNPNMPVFGADGVHAQFEQSGIKVYLGESKIHQDFGGAATDAAESMGKAKKNFQQEFDLLDSYIDFSGMDENSRASIIDLLNPYCDVKNENNISFACFIGFSSSAFYDKKSTPKYSDYEIKFGQEKAEQFEEKINNMGVSPERVVLFTLPFMDIDQLVSDFIAYFGIAQ